MFWLFWYILLLGDYLFSHITEKLCTFSLERSMYVLFLPKEKYNLGNGYKIHRNSLIRIPF